jgi:EAL domain-containing protein (putative c-di-GMP-specific phosphodiesterase class I)
LTADDVRPFTHLIHTAVSAPIIADGRELGLSASVGASILTASAAAGAVRDRSVAEVASALLRDADSAMYHAKEAGRDRTEIFSADTRRRIVNKFDTETELRQAINRDELVLVYQPQIDLLSGGVVGFEALVRWDHPERGRLFPADFMAVAEDSGLVVPMGRWVLAEACRASVVLEQSGNRSARMAVNVSAREMLSAGLVADLADILEATGASPDRLCLELTESALLPDASAATAVMRDLAELGLRLSLDDFGTGFSSLAYLQRLPLGELKIDRSFVEQIDESDGRAMVVAVLSLAAALGLDTVAEGVEHARQARVLAKLGCGTGQGFLFGRPTALAEAAALRPVLPTQRGSLAGSARSASPV